MSQNQSPVCYKMACPQGSTPFYLYLLIGIAGFLLAFIYDYILLIFYTTNGFFPELCIAGVHIHHLYFGILVAIFMFFLVWFLKPTPWRLMFTFFLGLGIGLAISDLISHLTIDPFVFYC